MPGALESRQLTAESRSGWRREAALVFLLYAALTIFFTWPLARGLARDVPGDLGDPLLNAWILAWDASHLGRGLWNANIFYPHPLALAYSEHLLPQALTILPVQLIANNPILSYNLLFLSTFVLSALGMFLFVREITGSRAAAFVAGAAYAFAPYRVTSIPHLQILSSQWMPFALFGFKRFFDSVRTRRPASAGHAGPPESGHYAWLCVGALAWIVQNLSCGYYMLFFSPVAIAYLAWEMTTRSLWRNTRVVLTLATACAVVFAVTVAVMLPYVELRQLGFSPRSLEETVRFSADTFAVFTADPNVRLWGPIAHVWPKAEGALFPGLTIVVLAAIGVARASRARDRDPKRVALLVISLSLIIALLLGWSIRLPFLRIASFSRALIVVAVIWSFLLAISAETRRAVGRWLASPEGFFTLVAVFAIVMSWGPAIYARGRIVSSWNLYSVFYDVVPGFDGVRVPARFAMILTLALSVLAGFGVAALTRARAAFPIAALATVAILVEGAAMPIPINQNAVNYRRPGLAPLPDSVADVPPVYNFAATLPPSAAIIELPLGEPAFDVRYMLYSTTHWRRLVNGYSGGAPKGYEELDQSLQDALERPARAWDAVSASRASHAIVHEASYAGDRGRQISAWLQAHGAQELAAFGNDRIFRIR